MMLNDPVFWLLGFIAAVLAALFFTLQRRHRAAMNRLDPSTLDTVQINGATVYAVQHAVVREYGNRDWIACRRVKYTWQPRTDRDIKLVRSGSGYEVYGHEELKDGTWVMCR